jgi:hypothetical protein
MPNTEQISKEYTTATFYEVLRLFPPVARLGKIVGTDTALKAHRFTTGHDGLVRNVEEYTVPIKRGSLAIIDIMALHMNRETLLRKFAVFSCCSQPYIGGMMSQSSNLRGSLTQTRIAGHAMPVCTTFELLFLMT